MSWTDWAGWEDWARWTLVVVYWLNFLDVLREEVEYRRRGGR